MSNNILVKKPRRKGDKQAFAQLYLTYKDSCFATPISSSATLQDAQDAVRTALPKPTPGLRC